MDLLVCYWSEVDSGVKIKYLTSVVFYHSKEEDMLTEILKALEKSAIPLTLMLSLGMDGPNINKSILNKLNEIKNQQLVKCPPSVAKYGYNIEDLCLNIYFIFKRGPHQWQDLFKLEESLGLEELILLQHFQSCWLSDIPTLE